MFTFEWFSCPDGITPNSRLTGPNNIYIHIGAVRLETITNSLRLSYIYLKQHLCLIQMYYKAEYFWLLIIYKWNPCSVIIIVVRNRCGDPSSNADWLFACHIVLTLFGKTQLRLFFLHLWVNIWENCAF